MRLDGTWAWHVANNRGGFLYLVRYLLHQVIGLLHFLCSQMLRYWLGLLLQSTAQTEDTRETIEHLRGENNVLSWKSCSQQLLKE